MSGTRNLLETLVLASGNRGKYAEFLALLPRGVTGKLLFAPDVARVPEVEETGETYAMNAILKARAWALISGLPSLADDSGIEAEALGWRPGVRSARAVEGSDADRNRWLLSQMEGQKNRRARFVAVVALSVPSSEGELLWTLAAEGVCEGHLAEREAGTGGFGYDPLFIPDGYDVSFAELPLAVKNQISHRAKALQNLFAQNWIS